MARKKKVEADTIPEVKPGVGFVCPESGRRWRFEMNPNAKIKRCERCDMNHGHTTFESLVCGKCSDQGIDLRVVRQQCEHADASGICCNEERNSSGIVCSFCMDFKEVTPLASDEDGERASAAFSGPVGRGKSQYTEVYVDLIAPSRYQTRRVLGDIGSLAANIAQHGIINPVTLRAVGSSYELIAGHRRVQAAKEAGLEKVPAILVECDDATAAEMCVAENMQRSDLSPIEEAEGVKALLDTGHSRQDAADRLGRSVAWVARRVNLLNLDQVIIDQLGDPAMPVALIPLAGLELIAALPAKTQQYVANYFIHTPPTIGNIRRLVGQELRDLTHVAFDTSACLACSKRTGAQPDLFDDDMRGEGGELGKCMDTECFDCKRREALAETVEGLKEKDPGAIIVSDSYEIRNMHDGIKPEYGYLTCKKTDKGAKAAFKIDDLGNARKVYVRGGHSANDDQDGDKTNQPTREQRRMAAVCRYMSDLIGSHLGGDFRSAALPSNPFRNQGLGKLAEFVVVTGTHISSSGPEPDRWSEVAGVPFEELADAIWSEVAPVLKQRVKYYKVSECDTYYKEACAIAQNVFGMDKDALDQAAE